MCGITGIIKSKSITNEDKISFENMLSMLIHRGPDGEGRFNNDNVILGMKRLSIIDLDNGWQPLWNENKSILIIANGEIYNYLELKEKLKKLGHTFSSKSDCESIIHLYEEYGIDFIKYLRGMFAICLYDLSQQKIFLIRDRMGEKPLYIYSKNEEILFSSEMKSLLSSKKIPFIFDNKNIRDYFCYQYIPEPNTAIKNIIKLPPANYIQIDLSNWDVKQVEYWKMENAPPNYGNPEELIRQELDEIHKIIIRSDVPIGVALSGGIDSSIITSLSNTAYPGKLQAFTIGYPNEPLNDERKDARELSNKLGIPLNEIELTSKSFVEDFEEMNFFRDDPIADISGYGYYKLNKEARVKKVSVLLQGQGGDELFWGYPWLKETVKISHELGYKKSFLKLFHYFIKKNTPNWNNKKDVLLWFISLFRIKGTIKQVVNFYNLYKFPLFYEMAPDFLDSLTKSNKNFTDQFNDDIKSSDPRDIYLNNFSSVNIDIILTKAICSTYLLENGITQGDRLSMASSVELRLPLCDYKLVELIIGLRKANKRNPDFKYELKHWLKKSVKGLISDSILNRPKKGFNPPVLEWHKLLFQKYGTQLIDGILVQSNIITKEAANNLSKGPFPEGVISPFSFKALVLENWARQMKELTLNAR